MKALKHFLNVAPAMLMWLVLSVFLWGFVFNLITDVPAEEKVVLFIDAPVTEETHLALRLQEAMGEAALTVQVRPFSYAMMSAEELENADLYILSRSAMDTYRQWLAPLPQDMYTGTLINLDGQPYGIMVHAAATGEGVAEEHIGYEQLDYYLCVGVNSLHVQGLENAVDNRAVACALALLD